jgi:uncharacterized protein YidB (DUF937 family)
LIHPGNKEKIMSMEDILKVLVDSRQGPASRQDADPMTDLIGSLLGGTGQPQQTQGAGGLGDMMGLLETVMGTQSGGTSMATADPVMMLLQPFVKQLATKMKISPEIAMVIVSFAVHKLLSHHPTSKRDSNSFDLDNMLQQMGSGRIDPDMLQSSGMITQLSRQTGLDEATTAKSLNTALTMLGRQIQPAGQPMSKPSSRGAAPKPAGKRLNSVGAKRGSKLQRPK